MLMAERLLMVYLSVSGTSPAAGAFCQDNAIYRGSALDEYGAQCPDATSRQKNKQSLLALSGPSLPRRGST